jgi:hypothetical protein
MIDTSMLMCQSHGAEDDDVREDRQPGRQANACQNPTRAHGHRSADPRPGDPFCGANQGWVTKSLQSIP